MKTLLPVRVLLRNTQLGTVHAPCFGAPPFALCGRRADDTLELWQRNGKWREDSTPHPLDIVGILAPTGEAHPLTDHFAR